jgi:inorganic pyrophosphatase
MNFATPLLAALAFAFAFAPASAMSFALSLPVTCDIARQPGAAPDELLAMIEIPAGGQVKYELDEASGRMEVDRFLSMPVAYPVNYGILPCTEGGDGDPLDVLVLTRIPVDPGALIRVRAVGVLRMRDAGEEDDKLVVVPLSAVDPAYDEIATLDDVPAAQLESIEAFFEVYKALPEPGGRVELGGWEGPEVARAIIRTGLVGG